MFRRTLLLCFVLMSPVAFADDAPAPVAEAAAPVAAANTLIGAAPEGKGQIVFFRESRFAGAAMGFKVREGDTEIAKLRNATYFVATVEPGKHEYNMKGETKDVVTLEVEPGETYYVKATIGMGIVAARPNLAPSDEATFVEASKKLKLAK